MSGCLATCRACSGPLPTLLTAQSLRPMGGWARLPHRGPGVPVANRDSLGLGDRDQ